MWIPKSEEDLRRSAADGTLAEGGGSYQEFKQQLEPTTGANKSLAQEMASFGLYSGKIMIGIRDERHRSSSEDALTPVRLAGLPERIEQIALTRCDPPLFVRVHTIVCDTDPTMGYIVIEIPQSPDAPHQVDHKYWGRGDSTKFALNDAQVNQAMVRRESLQRSAAADLDRLVREDPIRADVGNERGHVHLVAEPRGAPSDMLYRAISRYGWQQDLRQLINKRPSPVPSLFLSGIDSAANASETSDCWRFEAPRVEHDQEERALRLDFAHAGAIHIVSGRGTAMWRGDTGLVIFDTLVAALVRDLVALAAAVAQVGAFRGEWAFGFHIDGVAGLQAATNTENLMSGDFRYTDKESSRVVRASTPELEDRPNQVADDLVGRFLRSLGVRNAPQIRAILGFADDE